MKLHITFIVLFMAGCLIYLIIIVDIIRTSSVWRAISASYGRSPKDGSHGARWIIWGVILILSLSVSPNQARGVFPKNISNPSDVTPLKDLAATPHVTTTVEACFKSFAIPETLPLRKMLSLERRYSLNPLIHPKPLVPLPRSHVQSNNYAPLLAREHNQLNSNDLSDRLLAKARHYLNTPYKRGGSLQHGNATDCSGFVQYNYKKLDINLPRSSSEQAREGKIAARSLGATPHETTTNAACLKSSAIPETAPLMKSLPLEKRFLLKPLTHPKPVVLSPHTNLQLNNGSSPLAREHNQLKSKDLSDRLLAKARHYLNTPYRRGGSLQTGNATDCSGFVQYIYKKFDVQLPRSSSEQAQEGKVAACTMDFAKLIPGDLLFFSLGRRRVGHVGIYLGEGKMIHAADSRHGVVVSDLREPYYRGKFVVAKRILKEEQYQ